MTLFLLNGGQKMENSVILTAPETSIYANDGNEFVIIHSLTLGDILTATLLSILIIVVLLSRLLGRSSKW